MSANSPNAFGRPGLSGIRSFLQSILYGRGAPNLLEANTRLLEAHRNVQSEVRSLGEQLGEWRRQLGDLSDRAARIEKLLLVELAPHQPSDHFTRSKTVAPPRVSVIMPTRNRERYLGRAIATVRSQTYSDWELIVVNDGGTDALASLSAAANADNRIKLINQDHRGPSAARNRGIAAARGELVSYLDDDNLWYPNFLHSAVAHFESHPEVDFAYGALVYAEPRGGSRILWDPFDREKLLQANFIDTSTIVHRRRLVELLGGWNEDDAVPEDWELAVRYTAHKPSGEISALAVLYNEDAPDRMSTRPDAQIRSENLRARLKLQFPQSTEQAKF